MQRRHLHVAGLGVEVEHAQVGDYQLGAALQTGVGPLRAAAQIAGTGDEVHLLDQRAGVVVGIPVVEGLADGAHVAQPGGARQPHPRSVVVGADHRVVAVAVAVELGRPHAELGEPPAVEGKVPEVAVLLHVHDRVAPQRGLQGGGGHPVGPGLQPHRPGQPHQVGGVGEPGQPEGAHRHERRHAVAGLVAVGEAGGQPGDHQLVDGPVFSRRAGLPVAHEASHASTAASRSAPPTASR